jgi:hypothetical protein
MFRLEIRTGNAAFEDDPGELARILRVAAPAHGRRKSPARVKGNIR